MEDAILDAVLAEDPAERERVVAAYEAPFPSADSVPWPGALGRDVATAASIAAWSGKMASLEAQLLKVAGIRPDVYGGAGVHVEFLVRELNYLRATNAHGAWLVSPGLNLHGPAFKSLAKAEAGDFIYLDPPYAPVSGTANFTSYTAHGFSARDQDALYSRIIGLVKKNFYRGLRFHRVERTLVQIGDPNTRNFQRRNIWGQTGTTPTVGADELAGAHEGALVALMDRERLWFKARHGLDVAQQYRNLPFIGYVQNV